ncbi:MAG: beta-1,6-N-acetylglucosaminyltransferase [Almyronema sp.]
MRIAYIVLAHKLPEYIVRLVSTLTTEQSVIYIHIDKRANDTYCKTLSLLSQVSNVYFVQSRLSCRWGQFSIVAATLSALQALHSSNNSFDRVILLSGQDYPIKPIDYIQDFFSRHSQQQFIEYFSLEEENKWSNAVGPFQAERRLAYWHFFFRSKHIYVPIKRSLPNALKPYGGSQWWCFTKDFVEYLLQFLAANPEVIRHFRYTFIPDEAFFQTILLNSPFRDTVTNNSLRYTDWKNPNPFPPRRLTLSDFDAVKNSAALYARKFDPDVSLDLLEAIDQKLLKTAYA